MNKTIKSTLELENLLFKHTENEEFYLNNSGSFSKRYLQNNVIRNFINGKEVLEINVSDLKNSPLHIRKDSRYTFLPFHTYSNININYIYSGKCTYFINDEEIILNKGDICIFDTQVVRAKMKPQYDDIIINVVMQNEYFKNLLMLDSSNIISSFINRAVYSNNSHDNYIIFNTYDNKNIRFLFEKLLIENYNNRTYKLQTIQHYFSLIFLELLYLCDSTSNTHIHFSDKSVNNIFSIVNYIENNYLTASLPEVANIFGYHEKYLSSLLKKNYGMSFKEIQLEKRLINIEQQLVNSSLTINEIAEKFGFSNISQFYKLFSKKYGMSPKNYRNKVKKETTL